MRKGALFVLAVAALAVTALAYMRFAGGEIPFLSAYLGPATEPADSSDTEGVESEEGKPKDVTATVKVAPIRKGVLTEQRVLYGIVVPGKGALATISAPFEAKVLRILVRKGQEVAKDEPLVEVGPSEDSRLSLEQAQNKNDTAKQELDRIKQRLALKLATNQELIQATQAARDAELLLKSLSRKGQSKPVLLHADSAGIINSIAVQEGAMVTAGAALADVAALSKLEVQLGAEADFVVRLEEGQPLLVSGMGKTENPKLEGRVRAIAHTVNAATHLVDLFVTIPPDAKLLLGAAVQGEFSLASAEALIVPRSAVLPEEDHFVLYMIKDGHARKIIVDRVAENATESEIRCDEAHDGDLVAVVGNYELEDGMAVVSSETP